MQRYIEIYLETKRFKWQSVKQAVHEKGEGDTGQMR